MVNAMVGAGRQRQPRSECRLELPGVEVARIVEFPDLHFEGRKSFPKVLRGRLAADGDRSHLVQRVVVHAQEVGRRRDRGQIAVAAARHDSAA